LGCWIKIVARHAIRRGDAAHGRKGAERNCRAARVANADIQYVLGVASIVALRLRDDAVGAAKLVEVVDVDRAQIILQGGENVGDIDAEQLRLVAVDVEIKLRRGVFEQRKDLEQAGR